MKHSINKYELSGKLMYQKLEYKLNEILTTKIMSLLSGKQICKLDRDFYMILYWQLYIRMYKNFIRFSGET
jgi:hypothetical protein